MNLPSPRIVIHCEDGSCRLLDPVEVYWLEADGESSVVHTAAGEKIGDQRRLEELVDRLSHLGFVQVHRLHAVNLCRVTRVLVCKNGRDLEVELSDPVNRVLPVNDMGRRLLWAALGETG